MNAVLFSAIAMGNPSQCGSLQEIAISFFRENVEPEDLVNLVMVNAAFPPETVKALLEPVDYLTYHKVLWATIRSNERLSDLFRFGDAIYCKIRHQSNQPPIHDYKLAIALGKDMRLAFYTSRKRSTGLKPVIEHFDYPSLFLLLVENRQYGVPEYDSALESLLDEKLVDWLRGATAMFDVGVMNVLSHPLGLERVYMRLSQLNHDDVNLWIRNINYYAIRRLSEYAATQQRAFLSEVAPGIDVTARLAAHFDPDMINNKQGARKLVLMLQTPYRLGVPVEVLLWLRSNVQGWLIEKMFEPMTLNHQLLVSNQYLTKKYLKEDLRFLDTYVTERLKIRSAEEIMSIFEDPRTLRLLYEALSGQNRARLYQPLGRFRFHHLYKLQHASEVSNRKLDSLLDSLQEECFYEWISTGWAVFEANSDVFFSSHGAQHVAQRLLEYEKMRRKKSHLAWLDIEGVDYLSLLLLKGAFNHFKPHRIFSMDYRINRILPEKEHRFYRQMQDLGSDILFDRNIVAKLAHMLPLLHKAPVAIADVVPFMVNTVALQHASDEYIRQLNQLFRRALQSVTSVREFLKSEQNQEDFISLLRSFQTDPFQEFQDSLRHLNYNHVLVLRLAYHRQPRGGGIELLHDGVGAYCHELLPDYVLPNLLHPEITREAKTSTLQGMQYLSLVRLRQEPLLDQEMSQAIDSRLAEAKISWRHWFTRNSGDVFGDEENFKELVNALKVVPQDDYLLAPLQLVQLADSADRFNIVGWYALLDGYEKRFLSDRDPTSRRRIIAFETYIWQNEDAVDIDEIKLSVWFEDRVRVDKRVAVSNAISWPAVQAYKDDCLNSGKPWHPPYGLKKSSITSWMKKGRYKFLVDDRKYTGLPRSWFKPW